MASLGRKLLECCEKCDMVTILQLIEQGVPVDWSDEVGRTALQMCCASGWVEGVAVLLEHGADVNFANQLGWTALMQAAGNGHSTITQQLIAAGANLNQTNSYGWSVCAVAVGSKDPSTVHLVISSDKSHLSQALTIAAQLGDMITVQLLLDKKADPNVQLPDSGMTPLMLAACEGHTSVIELLLSRGAVPDITNALHMTALDVALSCGHQSLQTCLAPVTNLRSRFSAHIPLPTGDIAPKVTPRFKDQGPPHKVSSQVSYICAENQNPFPLPNISPQCQHPSSHFLRSPSPLLFPQSLHSPNSQCFPHQSPNFCLMSPNYPSVCYPHAIPNHQMQCFEFPPCPPQYVQQSTHCSSSLPVIPQWIFPHNLHVVGTSINLKSGNIRKSERRLKKWWKQIKEKCQGKKISVKVPVVIEPNRNCMMQENQLEALLQVMKLEKYYPVLEANKVDIETFLSLKENDLEEIGIVDSAVRSRILLIIKTLNQDVDNDSAIDLTVV